MIPNPIRKVLSSIRTHQVQCLLMGGQACVLYGGAEFSRDTDFVILADDENLVRLHAALGELQAECIAVPPFDRHYLDLGLAIHFRCQHPEAANLRIDVMSRMRGVEDFPLLWSRRTTVELDGELIETLALSDLVRAKKTQREKDWPMIARLVEANYFQNRGVPTDDHVAFWLNELRSPDLLISVAANYPDQARNGSHNRPLLAMALAGDEASLRVALREEQAAEQTADREYWLPLRKLLESLRQQRRSPGPQDDRSP